MPDWAEGSCCAPTAILINSFFRACCKLGVSRHPPRFKFALYGSASPHCMEDTRKRETKTTDSRLAPPATRESREPLEQAKLDKCSEVHSVRGVGQHRPSQAEIREPPDVRRTSVRLRERVGQCGVLPDPMVAVRGLYHAESGGDGNVGVGPHERHAGRGYERLRGRVVFFDQGEMFEQFSLAVRCRITCMQQCSSRDLPCPER